ncbi:hypothetical protein BpHYR1_011780 [Brachionus plicatilis]|uniref:Uncharacterized protein n=1 Tax=Brachionus plicatilis TaxID=10195 RepID=A0A3M7RTF7_BRAPC|nr:hypothetical protein BpHYR1_011780 [Brachionus plicatilis]
MEELRKEIIEYYSNLINEIDIKCEKAVLFFKTEEALNEIETNRENIISKIKQTEMIKLENFKDSERLDDGIFAFLISKRSSMDIELFEKSKAIPDEKFPKSWIKSQEKGKKFKFIVHLGQLIVSSSLRPDDFEYR